MRNSSKTIVVALATICGTTMSWGLDGTVTGVEAKKTANGYENWLDPVIGAHAEFPFATHWTAGLRGDIGGFGLGSNFAWQAVGSITWQASKLIGVTGAYRYFQQDYENRGGINKFKYDVAVSGPQLGVSFTF